MRFPRLSKALFGIFTVATLAVATLTLTTACKRTTSEEKEIKELSQKAAELDKLSQQANTSGGTQAQKLQQAGVSDIKPNAETMQLT